MPSRRRGVRPQRTDAAAPDRPGGESPPRDWPIGVIIAAGAAALYLATMCRTIYWGDAVEFILVADTFGIAHPSGYPTFTLLSGLVARPSGSSAPIDVNAVNALVAAGAVYVFWLLARGWFASTWAAALAAAVFAASSELWAQATAAEVYALHTLLVGAVLLAALRHAREPSVRRWLAMCFLWGLSLTNHLTAGLLVLPMGYVVATTWRRFTVGAKRAALGMAAVVAGLLPYLYLPIRSAQNPTYDQGNPETWRGLLAVISGEPFRYRLLSEPAGTIAREIVSFPIALAQQITWVGVALAVAGAVALARRRRDVFAPTLLLLAATVIYTACYNIPDKSGYYLPAYLVCALWLAAALDAALGWLRARRRTAAYAFAVIALALPAWQVGTNLRPIEKHDDRSLLDYANAVYESGWADAVVLCQDVNVYWALEWMKEGCGEPGGLRPVSIYWLRMPWYLDALARSGVAVPAETRERMAALAERLAAASASEFGRESERAADRAAREIAAANLERHPVVLCPGKDVEWASQWGDLHLRLRGLVYEVSAEPLEPRPFATPFPPPSRYRVDRMPRKEGRYVAERFATACNRLGIIWAHQRRDTERGIAALERAIEYDPDYAGAHKNLAMLYMRSAPDAERAVEHFRKYLDLDPRASDADAVRRRVEDLEIFIERQSRQSP